MRHTIRSFIRVAIEVHIGCLEFQLQAQVCPHERVHRKMARALSYREFLL